MSLNKGALLQGGKYRIEGVLGQGGFGITYLAMQTGLNRKVAIKEFFMSDFCERNPETSQVSMGTSGSKELVDKFKNKFIKEAQTIAGLNNPHIIRIHDIFEENGTAYYVMEYHDGGSLLDLVSGRGRLSEADAVSYTRQIADALQYIHERSMNHLDVKPGNVLLDEKGNAVLIDFGLAKRYDAEGNQTSTTPVGISHGYAPLEQYKKGGVSMFSPTTDIYSLGATFYKLITGKTPPEADDVNEDGLPAFPSDVSPSVAVAIERAMQPVRKNRPQSISEFLALLDTSTSAVERNAEKVVPVSNADESTVFPEDEKKDNNEDNKVNAPQVADSKPVVDESEKKKGKSWMLWVLIALIGVAVGLYFMGGSSNPHIEQEDTSAQVDMVDEYSAPASEVPAVEVPSEAPAAPAAPAATDVAAECPLPVPSAVDLGLSVKWADRNVGADIPEDYGSYFAWGETQPKSTYDWSTYKWCNGGYNQLTKYCTYSYYGSNGFTDGKTTLSSSDDAAYVNMGSSWRMPTEGELEELLNSCTWTWTTRNGKNGFKVTGPSGKSIFLPAAGSRSGSLYSAGSDGCYWSSSLNEDTPNYAWCLYFNSGDRGVYDYYRYGGRAVRAVAR